MAITSDGEEWASKRMICEWMWTQSPVPIVNIGAANSLLPFRPHCRLHFHACIRRARTHIAGHNRQDPVRHASESGSQAETMISQRHENGNGSNAGCNPIRVPSFSLDAHQESLVI